jgi:hypothetical protein
MLMLMLPSVHLILMVSLDYGHLRMGGASPIPVDTLPPPPRAPPFVAPKPPASPNMCDALPDPPPFASPAVPLSGD